MRLPERGLEGHGVHVSGFTRPMQRLVRPCFAWSYKRLPSAKAWMEAWGLGERSDVFSVPLFVVRFPATFQEIMFGLVRPAETHTGITMMYMTLGRN